MRNLPEPETGPAERELSTGLAESVFGGIGVWQLERCGVGSTTATSGDNSTLSLQPSLANAVSAFGAAVKAKLSAKAITCAPEDQLRGPLETFIQHMGVLDGHKPGSLVAIGETTLAGQGTRPDYAIPSAMH